MTARTFAKIYRTMRGVTPRKIRNALRKHAVYDTYAALDRHCGIGYLTIAEAQEFVDRTKEQRALDATKKY